MSLVTRHPSHRAIPACQQRPISRTLHAQQALLIDAYLIRHGCSVWSTLSAKTSQQTLWVH